MNAAAWRERGLRFVLHLGCAAPLAWAVWAVATNVLGPDPVAQWMQHTGIWGFRWLLVSLAMRPLARLVSSAAPIRFRRLFGLWAFAYGIAHFSMWLIERRSDPAGLLGDLVARPFTTAGFVALLALLPLAVTSTRGWQRRLGRRWVMLHRLAYLAVAALALHFWWGVKVGDRIARIEPVVYAAIAAVLLGWRAWVALRDRRLRTRASLP